MNPQPEFTFAFACDGVPGIRGQIVKAYGKVLVIEGVAMDANSWFTKTGMNVQRYATREDAEVAAAWLAADASEGGERVGKLVVEGGKWWYRRPNDTVRYGPFADASQAAAEARRAGVAVDADCDLTVGDDWSPEAREAAAKARQGGSSHNNPDVTGSRSGPAEEARLQRIARRKKLLASGRNPHKGGNDADCDLTGDAESERPYTKEFLEKKDADAQAKELAETRGKKYTVKRGGSGWQVVVEDESVSQAQHGAMGAAAGGKSKLGIPKSVGAEFMKADKGKGFK